MNARDDAAPAVDREGSCHSCGHRASRHWLPGGCHGTSGSNASACRCAFTTVRDERGHDEGYLNERGALHTRPRSEVEKPDVTAMRAALAAVLPEVQQAPAVDREALVGISASLLRLSYLDETEGEVIGRNLRLASRQLKEIADSVQDAADVRRAVAEEHGREWQPGDGDTRCQDCGHTYQPWFADNALWNLVMGGPEATGDPGGCLCPRCFMERAEHESPGVVWHVTPSLSTQDRIAREVGGRAALDPPP